MEMGCKSNAHFLTPSAYVRSHAQHDVMGGNETLGSSDAQMGDGVDRLENLLPENQGHQWPNCSCGNVAEEPLVSPSLKLSNKTQRKSKVKVKVYLFHN